MASAESPRWRRRLPPAIPLEPVRTTIIDLGDDLILEIFLRLPSLPSLVRAALACRAFLAAVLSAPAFRRRFRQLHPPPLLGFFFVPNRGEASPFVPVHRRSDPDLAAAVRGADVFLTRLPCHEDASQVWELLMCQGGYILLVNSSTRQIAAYNPLTRALDILPPPDEISNAFRGNFIRLDFLILSSEEADGSFRVLGLYYGKSEVRAAVFSFNTMDWSILTLSEPAIAQPSRKNCTRLQSGTLLNGSVYWPHKKKAYMLVLDGAAIFLHGSAGALEGTRGHLHDWGNQGWKTLYCLRN
ncbi:uncharacterized protein LOC120699449 [Panicum virgatum]|uniref:F-box domain-containing protein n=1 Tax=Panicum virgatum TaxID=38727 RepID=A0A8T0V276_PANVG|nr:uncharacterized protein LOC120699449 [Panicum virgatum]KAG2629240.1 hypothetical protein PVAP13_3KG433303 [Panicum virgatum]